MKWNPKWDTKETVNETPKKPSRDLKTLNETLKETHGDPKETLKKPTWTFENLDKISW